MPRSRFCFHSALISYVCLACSSNSRADFRCLFDVAFDPIPYTPQSLFSPFLIYFISLQISGLISLDSSTSKSDSFSSLSSPSSMSESLLFALSFQNQVSDLSSVSFVSAVLSLLSSISSCELTTKLASNFLLLQASTARSLADLN